MLMMIIKFDQISAIWFLSCFMKYCLAIRDMYISICLFLYEMSCCTLEIRASDWNCTFSDHQNPITIQLLYQPSLKYWVLVIKVAQGSTQRLPDYAVVQKLEWEKLYFFVIYGYFLATLWGSSGIQSLISTGSSCHSFLICHRHLIIYYLSVTQRKTGLKWYPFHFCVQYKVLFWAFHHWFSLPQKLQVCRLC